jgi:hypothetical protein
MLCIPGSSAPSSSGRRRGAAHPPDGATPPVEGSCGKAARTGGNAIDEGAWLALELDGDTERGGGGGGGGAWGRGAEPR